MTMMLIALQYAQPYAVITSANTEEPISQMNKRKEQLAYSLDRVLLDNKLSRSRASKLLGVKPSTLSNYLNHPERSSSTVLTNWKEELLAIVKEMKETADKPASLFSEEVGNED